MSAPLANLAPREIVETVLAMEKPKFLTFFGDTLILLVCVGPPPSELATALEATAPRGRESVAAMRIVEPMEFETVTLGPTERKLRSGLLEQREEPRWLAHQVESEPHFAAPLRKRAGIDAAYSKRISVGRAPNQDIVLRDANVSKFHGWFEIDEQGRTYFTDADSRNRTRVNGTPLSPRERTQVRAGEAMRFGSVEALLCSPAAFWEALRICAH